MPKRQISSCTVQKLDGEDIIIDIKELHKSQDLLNEVCKAIGLEESVYFGLRFNHPKDEKISWFDPNKGLKKQLRKASHRFKFGVQFYPSCISKIKQEITRYQFVLQARENFLTGLWSSSVPTQALLASYLVQAEVGNYEASLHDESYLESFFFVPDQSPEFLKKVSNFHQNHCDLSKSDVDWLYLETSQKTSLFGMELFDVWDSDGNMMKFGMNSSGIHVLHINTVLHTFLWPNVLKCIFKKNEILIKLQVGDKIVTVGFTSTSETEAKRISTSASFTKYFSINGKRKIIKHKKKQTQKECSHKEAIQENDEQLFKRVDSKRFSKRFVKVTESLSLDLPEDDNSSTFEQQEQQDEDKEDKNEEKHSIKDEDMKESPGGVDTGDVYLGYPNNIVVPIITQTAPSEQSLELEIIDDAEIIEETENLEEVENVTVAGEEENLKEEHVEIIEIVDIEYADEAKTGGDASIDDELTSTIVEIRIVTSEGETKVTSEEKTKDETTLNLSTSEDPVSARSNQEVAVEFGDETLESEGTDQSKRQSTLLESIERVLNESYEIVIEDQPKEE